MIDAQSNEHGIPAIFIKKKEEELVLHPSSPSNGALPLIHAPSFRRHRNPAEADSVTAVQQPGTLIISHHIKVLD